MCRAIPGCCARDVATSPRPSGSSPRLSHISTAFDARATASFWVIMPRRTWSRSSNGSRLVMNSALRGPSRRSAGCPLSAPSSRFAGSSAARVISEISLIRATIGLHSSSSFRHRLTRVSRRSPSVSSVVSPFSSIRRSSALMRACSASLSSSAVIPRLLSVWLPGQPGFFALLTGAEHVELVLVMPGRVLAERLTGGGFLTEGSAEIELVIRLLRAGNPHAHAVYLGALVCGEQDRPELAQAQFQAPHESLGTVTAAAAELRVGADDAAGE